MEQSLGRIQHKRAWPTNYNKCYMLASKAMFMYKVRGRGFSKNEVKWRQAKFQDPPPHALAQSDPHRVLLVEETEAHRNRTVGRALAGKAASGCTSAPATGRNPIANAAGGTAATANPGGSVVAAGGAEVAWPKGKGQKQWWSYGGSMGG